MKIFKIALTGGPCAGKTTMLKNITEHLNEKGISNVVVPETATELIVNGVVPKGTNKSVKWFQDIVLRTQVFKEDMSKSYVSNMYYPASFAVMICDRGIIDGKAYLSNGKDFDDILKSNNLSYINTLDSYDLVVDLITLADCNKDLYNLDNEARTETKEQAIKLDRKTSNAWAMHRNLKIINTSVCIDEEASLIFKYIDELLSFQKKKIENYLVDLDFDAINNYDFSTLVCDDYYLDINNNGYDYVVKKRTQDDDASYLFSVSKEKQGDVTIIEDKVISKDDFDSLLNKYNIIKKLHYDELCFVYNRQLYTFKLNGNDVILEVEKNKLNKSFKTPSCVNSMLKISSLTAHGLLTESKVFVKK